MISDVRPGRHTTNGHGIMVFEQSGNGASTVADLWVHNRRPYFALAAPSSLAAESAPFT